MSNPFKSSKNNRFEMPETKTNTDSEIKSVSSLDRNTKISHNEEFFSRERGRGREERGDRTHDTRPSFIFKSSKPTQKIYYEHNNEDFPELVIVNSDPNIGCTLDYKNASLKEEKPEKPEKPETVEIFEPGWLYIKTQRGSNNILKKYCPPIKQNKQVISPQQKLNNLMNNVIQKMEERRYKFIEDYGEDTYERDYNIQSYYEMVDDYEYYSDDGYYSDGDY
jgi:hypothetical protein